MWAAASVTDRLVDGRPSGLIDQSVPTSRTFGAGVPVSR
jgi:hypothetical protein